MGEDIPKETLAVLLVLAVILSIVGTWTVLDAISSKSAQRAQPTPTPQNTGNAKVSLTIGGGQNAVQPEAPQEKKSYSNGIVAMVVNPPIQ